jgi:hypothetical protein
MPGNSAERRRDKGCVWSLKKFFLKKWCLVPWCLSLILLCVWLVSWCHDYDNTWRTWWSQFVIVLTHKAAGMTKEQKFRNMYEVMKCNLEIEICMNNCTLKSTCEIATGNQLKLLDHFTKISGWDNNCIIFPERIKGRDMKRCTGFDPKIIFMYNRIRRSHAMLNVQAW